jgi:hypothetical protein
MTRRNVATRPTQTDPDPRWRDYPWLARATRWSVFLIPVIVSFLFALAATELLPEPDGVWPNVFRWLLIAAASTLVLIGLQHLAKRFIPLATLFSLTLVFPDSAPSRFGLALRTGTTRQLKAKIDGLDEDGLGDTPREAAESLLELVAALSKHDRITRGHSERVRAYSRMIGDEMELAEHDLERLHWAGLLHDVGKLYVPDEILNKPGELTEEEFEILKEHPVAGQRLVEPLTEWLGPSAAAVWEHHERWDGAGYPAGIPSEQTALASRIVCVADAFDVMTSVRTYKQPISAKAARAELERCAGRQFDPLVVRAMMSLSLGKLWGAMGPLSLIAQLRLFPRRVLQGGAAVGNTLAVVGAVVITGIVAGLPWTDRGDDGGAAAVEAVEAPDPTLPPPPTSGPDTAPSPSSEPPVVVAPSTTSTSTTSTTTTSTTSTTTSTTSTTTTSTTSTTAPTTSAAPTTVPVTVITTVPATTSTTTPSTTTTTTTTTLPIAPSRLTLGSSADGDVVAEPVLDLLARAPSTSASLPNYDTDRNGDPGLTIRRAPDGLAGGDPTTVQIWRAPSSVATLMAPVRLQLWFAPASDPGGVYGVVTAGLFECTPDGLTCTTLAADVSVLITSLGEFQGVSFDLTPPGGDHAVEPGRVVEIRVAVPDSSSTDLFVAYDTAQYPATLTFG